MSNHNIGFYEDLTKIIFQLSSNTYLISCSVCGLSSWFESCLVRKPKDKFSCNVDLSVGLL